MTNTQPTDSRTAPDAREFDRMMDQIRAILIDGIKHGFFNGAISVQVSRVDRREVLISAGKSYKYTIVTDDLPH